METEEEEDTNDEDFTVEIRQFSSCSHRFSKVSEAGHQQAESGKVSSSWCPAPLDWTKKTSTLCGVWGLQHIKLLVRLGKWPHFLEDQEFLPCRHIRLSLEIKARLWEFVVTLCFVLRQRLEKTAIFSWWLSPDGRADRDRCHRMDLLACPKS